MSCFMLVKKQSVGKRKTMEYLPNYQQTKKKVMYRDVNNEGGQQQTPTGNYTVML